MGARKGGFGDPRWHDLLERQPRIVSCSGPVTLTGGTVRGYSRVIWIPSSLGRGHHINLDPTSGSAFWEFTLGMWEIAYIRLNDADFKSPGARIAVQVTDPRFRITPYGSYDPHPNDLFIAMRNGDIMNVAGGSGDGKVYTAWGQILDTWRIPTMLNSWVHYADAHGTGHPRASYRREGDRVVLQGLIKPGTLDAPAFQLPMGYRPFTGGMTADQNYHHMTVQSSGGPLQLWVGVDGSIKPRGGAAGMWLDLADISFPVGI